MAKYIELSLETDQGYTNECWVPTCASVLLSESEETFGLVVSGYKDKASKDAGKTVGENKGVSIDLSTMASWPALKTEILNFLVTDSSSPFVGGILEDL